MRAVASANACSDAARYSADRRAQRMSRPIGATGPVVQLPVQVSERRYALFAISGESAAMATSTR